MAMRWCCGCAGVLLIGIAFARAQTTAELTLQPWPDELWGQTTDKMLYQQQGHLKDHSGDNAQVFWWDSIGRFRFDRHDPDSPEIAYRYLTANFDTNSPSLPDHLDKVSLAGGLHLGRFQDGDVSLVGGIGWSGDLPFADADGLFGIGHLLWQRRMNAADSLVLSLDYDGSGAFLPDVPLPGFQFVHRTEPLTYALGFPHSYAGWRLTDRLVLSVDYAVPYSLDAYLDYALGGGFSLFANAANSFEAFQLYHRPDTDRLFEQMRRVEIGVRYQNQDMWHGLSLDVALAVGYAFDQKFSRGWDVRSLDTQAEISDEPYAALILRGTF